jgi:hypothetical protein
VHGGRDRGRPGRLFPRNHLFCRHDVMIACFRAAINAGSLRG